MTSIAGKTQLLQSRVPLPRKKRTQSCHETGRVGDRPLGSNRTIYGNHSNRTRKRGGSTIRCVRSGESLTRKSHHGGCNSGCLCHVAMQENNLMLRRASRGKGGSRTQIYAASGAISMDLSDDDSASYWKTVIPSALAMMLCNVDRICLSVAILPLAADLGWAEGVQGIVQSAFLWGYVSTQLVGGTLADRFGGKTVMGWGMLFFSASSMLLPLFAITPLTQSLGIVFPAVLLSRFLVGLGEGVALPSANNLMARNISLAKRASAFGGMFTGFHSGNLVGLLASPILLEMYGWRSVFYVFGLLGLPLFLLWNAVVPDKHNEQQSRGNAVSAAEETREPASFATMLQTKAVWAIITANIVNHWGYFMYLNWMPTYFYKVLGMNLRASSFMSFVPWLVMAFGSVSAGYLCDYLVNSARWNRTRVRKMIQTVAFLGPVPALLALATGSLSPGQALVAMTLALGLTSVGQFTANISEVAPNDAGRLFGLSNTFGCFSGIAGVSIAGFLVEKTGSFETIFLTTAVLNCIGTLVWQLFASAERQL
ncbi:Putative anion transporter 4 [Picochlorum sp. SENEW3]|nr:Putative anion transporter 4 [Picochlorum sp. SENEW3]